MAQAVERALTHHGYTPVLAHAVSPGGATEDDLVELLIEHGVAGIVFVSGLHADTTASRDRYHRLSDRGVPVRPDQRLRRGRSRRRSSPRTTPWRRACR